MCTIAVNEHRRPFVQFFLHHSENFIPYHQTHILRLTRWLLNCCFCAFVFEMSKIKIVCFDERIRRRNTSTVFGPNHKPHILDGKKGKFCFGMRRRCFCPLFAPLFSEEIWADKWWLYASEYFKPIKHNQTELNWTELSLAELSWKWFHNHLKR